MSDLRQKRAPIREKRLNALSAYYGDSKTLAADLSGENVQQRIRTFSQNTYDEILYAIRFISGIQKSALIIHGSRGCAAALLQSGLGRVSNLAWAVSDLTERDTIMGSENKLRETILHVYKTYQPEIIFVVSTPVVAINNDDIAAIAEDLREELGIAIVPIYADGFRSKNGITGYDLAAHAVAKNLFHNPGQKGNFINLLSVSESPTEQQEIVDLLEKLGISVNPLPLGAGLNNFKQATAAKLSVSINPDETDYLGKILEKEFGVPWISPVVPIGAEKTSQWVSTVAEKLALGTEAQWLIDELRNSIKSNELNYDFKNLRIYLSLPPARAFALADLLESWGADVVGISITHVDILHTEILTTKNYDVNCQVHVGDGHPFEMINIVKRLHPDIFIGQQGIIHQVASLGIPVINTAKLELVGYYGIENIAHKLKNALENQYFEKYLAEQNLTLYLDNWYSKSVNWYIKQEVK